MAMSSVNSGVVVSPTPRSIDVVSRKTKISGAPSSITRA